MNNFVKALNWNDDLSQQEDVLTDQVSDEAMEAAAGVVGGLWSPPSGPCSRRPPKHC